MDMPKPVGEILYETDEIIMEDYIGNSDSEKSKLIVKDFVFKHLIKIKLVLSIILKFSVPYFKDMTLQEIARHIYNEDGELNSGDAINDTVESKATEAGTAKEKNIRYDSVFRVKINDEVAHIRLEEISKALARKSKTGKEITINAEMQSSTHVGYSLVSRAIYYGAALLRDTLNSQDKGYENIHKVYSIWFCLEDLKFHPYRDTGDEYIHRFGIRRFYSDIGDAVAPPEPESDLIEVVMIEMNKVQDKLINGNDEELDNTAIELDENTKKKIEWDGDLADLLCKALFKPKSLIDAVEKYEGIKLDGARQEVTEVMKYGIDLKDAEARGKEEGKKEGIKIGEERGMKIGEEKGKEEGIKIGELNAGRKTVLKLHRKYPDKTYAWIINYVKELTDLDNEIISLLRKEFIKN